MRHFPIFLDTKDLSVLVVGAGEVAARKIELLLKTEANIKVVAPDVAAVVQSYADQGLLNLHTRAFNIDDLQNIGMVFIATANEELNQSIKSQAAEKRIIANVVDQPELCDFITPSIVDRSPITIAMSSGGVAPVLLRYLRERLEAWIPNRISELGTFAQKYRDKVKQALPTVTQRRYFWEQFFNGASAEKLLQGNVKEAESEFLQDLEARKNDQSIKRGEVYLIGAGPGDPELLTFRALRLMQQADVVVFDRLVSPEIMDKVRRDAEKIYVGKAKSNHTLPQEEISQLLADKALEGNRVVRLKGGDPFVFGRGGEEIETLVQNNVRFQVVPGITAANGAASYAGIPLTHRDHAQSVVFATGHLRDNSIDLDWPALVQKNQTAVFYMGLTGLPVITENLIKHGMPDTTPIALIENATLPHQRVVAGTLATILQNPETKTVKPPALIIVGGVVSLHKSLNWFNEESVPQ